MLYALLTAVILVLAAKYVLLKVSLRQLADSFTEKVTLDTNTLIYTASHDRDLCRLAQSINAALRVLRQAHHRYTQGDRELKEAITNISHDLRTPLTAICGYLDLMRDSGLSAETRQYLGIIENRAAMMKQLTEELFSYSVILSHDPAEPAEEIAVNAVLEESIMGLFAEFDAHGITPEISIPETRVMRRADRAALSRIFSNLLMNAVKYSDGDFSVSMDSAGTVIFENTASRLTALQAERLFDRFYTVEQARNSTGLGLSIARTLTEQMGGRLESEFCAPKLRIIFSLPAEQNNAADTADTRA